MLVPTRVYLALLILAFVMCATTVTYTPEQLFSLNRPCNNNGQRHRVDLDTWHCLLDLGICSRSITKRGGTSIRPSLCTPLPCTPSQAHCAVINSRSVKNKTTTISEYIKEHDLDILAITETWLRTGDVDQPVIVNY